MMPCRCTFWPRVSAECICDDRAQNVRVIGRIRELLRAAYTAEGIRIWLASANRNLGGASPSALILAGRSAEVLTEAERVAAA